MGKGTRRRGTQSRAAGDAGSIVAVTARLIPPVRADQLDERARHVAVDPAARVLAAEGHQLVDEGTVSQAASGARLSASHAAR